MNKRHQIDELFREQLGQSKADVPTDMWDRIAAERGQLNRKPKLLWLWSSLGVVVVVAGLLLATQWFESSPQTEENTSIKTSQQIAQSKSNNQPSTSLEATKNQLEETQIISNTVTNLNSNRESSPSSTNNPVSNSLKKGRANKASLYSESIKIKESKSTSSANILDEEQATNLAIVEETTIDPLTEKENRILGPHQRLNQSVVNTIPILSFDLSAKKEVKLFEKSATSCARFNSPFFHLDLEVLLGPAYAQQQLTTRTSESSNHLEKRIDSESADMSYSAGLRLAATSNAGLGLKTGLIYSQINDIFEHEVGSEMNINIHYGSNGEIISIDTTFEGAYIERHQNQLKFLEMPLLLGYETKIGKFRVGVNAGAYLQLIFDAKGQIFSPATEEPIAFGQIGDRNVLPIFNQRASAAWYAGASIAYNLHSRYSIIAEPYFKTFPRALSAPDYDLTQNYWTVGMQLGLRMRL